MFVLTKETDIDGYYSAFDRLIACSSEYEVVENLEKTLHEEKEQFLSVLESYDAGSILPIDVQIHEFKKLKTLSKYFANYMQVVDGYFNFEITQVEEL